MKKMIVVTLLILMCATCLIGCSGEDDSSNNVIDNETQQEVADSDTEHKDGLVVDAPLKKSLNLRTRIP